MTSTPSQLHFWNARFAGTEYFYGFDAGPVARRAVRYHRPLWKGSAPSALDIGCGEGQDLAFLAEAGYVATGLEPTASGAQKTRRLLHERGLQAEVVNADWREYSPPSQFDLVLAVNSLQFLGADAALGLERARDAVAPGGVLGLSLFARAEGEETVHDGVAFFTEPELLAHFDCEGAERRWQRLETAQLAQWNRDTNRPQPFLTLVAQRLK